MPGLDDSYTKALLHMDGADASNTFTDESGKIWTPAGSSQIDTAQYKFGGSSGLFASTYIDTPDSDDFNMGSGDFTIDFWMKKAAINTLYRMCGQSDSAATVGTRAISIYHNANNTVSCEFFSASGTRSAGTETTIDTNWHHIAGVRYGNTLKLYLDGIAGPIVGDVTGMTAYNSANKFAIGREGELPNNPFNGWIDELRISKGIARWTANFTPPTREYGGGGQVIIWSE
jgi:hypothetical protein